jgi:hypothetical protein
MTCKDCIHLQPNTEHCNEYDIEVDVKPYRICAEMVSKDGTYHNGTDHCPKCGKPVPQWGLCDECDRLYDSWESVSK